MKNAKKTIAVFFGGCSTEYEVSLQSASAVIGGVDEERYRLIPVGIDHRTGEWFRYCGDRERIAEDEWQSGADCVPAFPSMDKGIHGLCYLKKGQIKTISLDAAIPVLHGKNGEDGTLQGTLELMGVPVIGCGLLASAVCMDKVLAHRIVAADGIKTAESFTLRKGGRPGLPGRY
ncbi:MAG TPA: hypothetical protein DF613_08185 [Lachnospiraceae bacterium]|nr:hypothetical protein [Lachnospiraceae bacterium]